MKRYIATILTISAALSFATRTRAVPIGTEPVRGHPRALRTLWILDRPALAAAGIERPTRIAFDGDGRLHVLDSATGRIVTLDPDGHALHSVGGYGADETSFLLPIDLVVDRNQSVLVLDRGRGAVLAFDRDGRYLATRALDDAAADEAREAEARLVLDSFGTLYLLAPRERDLVRLTERLAPARLGRYLVPEDSIRAPRSAAFLPSGEVWVHDVGALRLFSSTGRLVLTRRTELALTAVSEMALDPEGFLYVADPTGQRIVVLEPRGALEFERTLGGAAVPWRPTSIAYAPSDRIAVADPERREIQVLAVERGDKGP